MSNINNLLDFMYSFPKKKDKLLKFINNSNIKLSSKKEQYFLNYLNDYSQTDTIPAYILEEQEKMISIIENNRVTSVVAPTSFGKTYVINKLVMKYNGTKFIISPTLSLCNEYFMKLKKDTNIVSMTPYAKADIYILTPEKFMIGVKTNSFDLKDVSLFVFDEFYETFSGDRYQIFEDTYLSAKKYSKRIVQVIPHRNVTLPDLFKPDAHFYTEASATSRVILKFFKDKSPMEQYISTEFNLDGTDGYCVKTDIHNENELFHRTVNKALELNRSLLILSGKKEMYKRLKLVGEKIDNDVDGPIIREIKKYLDKTAKHTQLAKYITKGIAYHNGTTDRFLRLLIESAFKSGEIRILFGNSAITKGVNLSPDILYVLEFPASRSQKSIRDIEILNAFGRTGRTIQGKQIGRIIICLKKSSIFKNKDSLIKGSNVELELSKPEIKQTDISIDFQSAYKNYIVNKRDISISFNELQGILSYIKPSEFKSDLSIFDTIKSIYKILFSSNGKEVSNKITIDAYTKQLGYSYLLEKNRARAISLGYITGQGWPTENEDYKNTKNERFKQGTYHEDVLANYSYKEYEKTAGFYFVQLFSHALERLVDLHPKYLKYVLDFNERVKEEESIATEFGWPDAFVEYYLHAKKNSGDKKYLDYVLSLIKKD